MSAIERPAPAFSGRQALALVWALAAALVAWLFFAVWPSWLDAILISKKAFINSIFNGVTLAGLYFLVASGFTLVFGLMRNVNLAHGSLYLLGAYLGYEVADRTGPWLGYLVGDPTIAWYLAVVAGFLSAAIFGILLQILVFRRMEGQELRQTLVTIGISIVMADLMLWVFGADFYQIMAPKQLAGPVAMPFVIAVKSSGEAVYLSYPIVRLAI